MMGDLDSCLDAFKHLPYFKPLYTTILRQQMQYLTEQLSQHAGEESLVLTTNISAGTISSLTSTYGTGFLDLRADIKKQFTMHCAKNKMKYDGSLNRTNTHIDNIYTQDQPIPTLKRKRPDIHHSNHSVVHGYSQPKDKHVISDGYSQAKDKYLISDGYSRVKDKHVISDGYSQAKDKHVISDGYSQAKDKHMISDGYSQAKDKHLISGGYSQAKDKHLISDGYSQTKDKHVISDGYSQAKDKHVISDGYSQCNPVIIDGYSQTKVKQAVIDGYSQPMVKQAVIDGYSQPMFKQTITHGYSQPMDKQAITHGYSQPNDKHAIGDGYRKSKPVNIGDYSQTNDYNHVVIDGYSHTKGIDKNNPAVKARKAGAVLSNEGVANIEIANVRSLQEGEDSVEELDSNKTHEKVTEAGECKDSSTLTIKQEPVEDDSFMVVEATEESECNETLSGNKSQVDGTVLQESGLQEVGQDVETDVKIPGRVVRGVSILKDETDDVITVRKSYLSSSDEGSLPEKVSTETDDVVTVCNSYLSGSEEGSVSKKNVTEVDGSDMWLVAGVNSEANLEEMSEDKRKRVDDLFDKQHPEPFEEVGSNKSVESVMNTCFTGVTADEFSSHANVMSDYESGAQFTFNMSTPTQIHKPMDENRVKYECRYCSQSFTCYSSQKRHERRHTGETPWACEFCDKKFYRKDDLHVHSLKHSGQKPYMCPICLIGYCKKKLLDIHIASHGEWPTASVGSASSDSTY